MSIYSQHNTRVTSQTDRARGDQERNNAGGYVFTITDHERLKRFLILGIEGGTFYVQDTDLLKSSAGFLTAYAERDGRTFVDTIVEISHSGRAIKNTPALFTLAIAASANLSTRQAAMDALPLVARTSAHLFTFLGFVTKLRGEGRSLVRGLRAWYTDKDIEKLAYQVIKYRNREGYTHRDALRIAHPKPVDDAQNNLFRWIVGKRDDADLSELPEIVRAYLEVTEEGADIAAVLAKHPDLPWEALPTDSLNDPAVIATLIRHDMPMTALLRNLSRFSRAGVFRDRDLKQRVISQLTDATRIHAARVHPMQVLGVMQAYKAGQSAHNSSRTWEVDADIHDALDAAFYLSFDNVEPTGKRFMVALDISGSMGWNMAGDNISCAQAGAALALLIKTVEKDATIVGFDNEIRPLNISPRQRLSDAFQAVGSRTFGTTDASAAMAYALKNNISVDTFIVITDNETYAGKIHPFQALRKYREKTGINAKLIVIGMTVSEFSIADPSDAGMLDVVGFDTSIPSIISEFSKD